MTYSEKSKFDRKSATPRMKIAVVPKPGADFEVQEREIPTPGQGQVRIKVHACGICFSEHIVKDHLIPGITYPRSPGHEISGTIDEVGPGVTAWKKGQRVGVGGHDFTRLQCRRGDFVHCANEKIAGIHYDGGYAEYMVAPWEAVASMPDALDTAQAAPLLCAGITAFNSLRHSGAKPGDLAGVLGIGGPGLDVQFANKFGYQVAGISRGKDSEALAKKLGAHIYIDSSLTDAAAELQKLGGAKTMTSVIDGLGPNGTLLVIGASSDPIEAVPNKLLMGTKRIQGWASGTATDSEDALRFAEYTGVRPMIEKFPLDKVNEAYNRMTSGEAQFRVVLTM
jgi:D-arabinose 1-dehydrogenase-like Zn-dependent alcohol dehydrogenase